MRSRSAKISWNESLRASSLGQRACHLLSLSPSPARAATLMIISLSSFSASPALSLSLTPLAYLRNKTRGNSLFTCWARTHSRHPSIQLNGCLGGRTRKSRLTFFLFCFAYLLSLSTSSLRVVVREREEESELFGYRGLFHPNNFHLSEFLSPEVRERERAGAGGRERRRLIRDEAGERRSVPIKFSLREG